MAEVFDPELLALMAQTMYWAPLSGVDAGGDYTYGAATAITARVEMNVKTFANASGEDRTSEYAIYTEQQINELDRVWLPGDSPLDATKARKPMKVYEGVDEDGSISHYEVYV